MHPRDAKERLRRSIKERLARLGDVERKAESRTLCKIALAALPPAPLAVCGYFPLKDEADIRPLLLTLLDRGDALYLPKYIGKGFDFFRVRDLENLPAGEFGIPEPPEGAEKLDPSTLDVALVPARAFDREGRRMGRGNGGYDKWIRAQRKAKPDVRIWGIALECQLVNDIPMEAHDETVDAVVTARGVLVAGKKGGAVA